MYVLISDNGVIFQSGSFTSQVLIDNCCRISVYKMRVHVIKINTIYVIYEC